MINKLTLTSKDIKEFKEYIKQINPDEVIVQTPSKDKFKKAFGINDVKLYEIYFRRLKTPFSLSLKRQ